MSDLGSYEQPWWLPGGHLQTIWGRVFRRGPRVPMRREVWRTPDDDELIVDRAEGPDDAPVLLVLHGLEGSSQSLYVHGLLDQGRRRGWRGVAINFRSCARTEQRPDAPFLMNLTKRLYHSGETEDLAWVVERLTREVEAPLGLVGVSLGGNVLLKWLGERADDLPRQIAAAGAMSVPYDLAAASRHLMKGLGPLYVRYFLRSLKRKALLVAEEYPGSIDVEEVRAARSFWAIDDAAVAPLHGFADAADYYDRSSSIDFIDSIRLPTLLVNAVDDPFLPPEVLPVVRERAAPAVEIDFPAHGGHVGFVMGTPWNPRYWAEERIVEFLAGHITKHVATEG